MDKGYYMLYDVFKCPQTFLLPRKVNGMRSTKTFILEPGVKYKLPDDQDNTFINGLKACTKQIPFSQADYDRLIELGYENYLVSDPVKRSKPEENYCPSCGGRRNAKIKFCPFKVVE